MTMTAARPTAIGDPGYTETWPCKPESAHRARLLVSAALNAWGIGELADVGKLIVSELVTNAVNHTSCRMLRVFVARTSEDVVRIGVADKSRGLPVIANPDGTSEGGRGLLLIDTMSCRWGYDEKPWGKVVWADVRAADATC